MFCLHSLEWPLKERKTQDFSQRNENSGSALHLNHKYEHYFSIISYIFYTHHNLPHIYFSVMAHSCLQAFPLPAKAALVQGEWSKTASSTFLIQLPLESSTLKCLHFHSCITATFPCLFSTPISLFGTSSFKSFYFYSLSIHCQLSLHDSTCLIMSWPYAASASEGLLQVHWKIRVYMWFLRCTT